MKPCVCSECGHEHESDMSKPCPKCGSVRVVLVSFVEEHFGDDWRETCFKKPRQPEPA